MEDCYFFYYSTCGKGNACPFRHCEAAKLNEVLCPQWEKSKTCSDAACSKRHSFFHLQKARSVISCYWEANGGCKRPHCPFKHNSDRPTPQESPTTPAPVSLPPAFVPSPAVLKAVASSVPPQNVPTKNVILSHLGKIEKPKSPRIVQKTNSHSVERVEAKKLVSEPDAPIVKTSEPAKLDFQVKSFEEIMREKRMKRKHEHNNENEQSIPAPTTISPEILAKESEEKKPKIENENGHGKTLKLAPEMNQKIQAVESKPMIVKEEKVTAKRIEQAAKIQNTKTKSPAKPMFKSDSLPSLEELDRLDQELAEMEELLS